jgi:UDP:flavonoid glycosyltransferase YjiC (YdhE family)
VRALVNVGDYLDQYADVPPNVIVDRWFPQPSVIPQVRRGDPPWRQQFVHRMPVLRQAALIMPYVWDGHDNATRVQETGHGLKLDRYGWSDDELAASIMTLLTDAKMKAKLRRTSKAMRARHGPTKAARVIDALTRRRKPPSRTSRAR